MTPLPGRGALSQLSHGLWGEGQGSLITVDAGEVLTQCQASYDPQHGALLLLVDYLLGAVILQASHMVSIKWGWGTSLLPITCLLLLFNCWVVSGFLWHHGLQLTRLPLLHYLLEFAQTHVHWVSDAIQPSYPLSSPSPPSLSLSSTRAFQWVSSLHQVVKLLDLQLQHQSFQWICRVYWQLWFTTAPYSAFSAITLVEEFGHLLTDQRGWTYKLPSWSLLAWVEWARVLSVMFD